uniref:CTCHY-type domain-containing protein n=1 Tax=Strongyloides stercoralis TaxID=6248 RepID=A0A0K0EHE2_STRER
MSTKKVFKKRNIISVENKDISKSKTSVKPFLNKGKKRFSHEATNTTEPPIKKNNPNLEPLGERTHGETSKTDKVKESNRRFKQKSKKQIAYEREKRANIIVAPKLKERIGVKVLDNEDDKVPHCPHGPCLLFEKPFSRESSNIDVSYSCAVYRSDKCDYNLDIIDWNKIKDEYIPPERKCDPFEYGQAAKSYKELSEQGKEIFFCETCWKCFNKHACPMIGPINYDLLNNPLEFLVNAIQENEGEAQYWFKDETHEIIYNGIKKGDFDGLLCIGTPTVFQKLRTRMRCFLLDVDERFKYFFEADEFAQFSMLVNYFYDPKGKEQLENFFKETRRLLILCDPPFAVFISTLQKSIDKLKLLFKEKSEYDDKEVYQMFVLPIFVGKHLRDVQMLDYKVTYSNHRVFSNPDRTIVRLFTDVEQTNFELPEPYYRFCSECSRYVVSTNEHCDVCEKCPSMDGFTYKHCFTCERCVKPKYKHCKRCKCCHLPGRCNLRS